MNKMAIKDYGRRVQPLKNTKDMNAIIWTLILSRPGRPDREVAHLLDPFKKNQTILNAVDGLIVKLKITQQELFASFEAEVSLAGGGEQECFLTLRCHGKNSQLYTFLGKAETSEIYRQSPHPPANCHAGTIQQAVPMIAVGLETGFLVAVSDTPAFYENHTTQAIDVNLKEAAIASGDCGEMPGIKNAPANLCPHYHRVKAGQSHSFNGILFRSLAADITMLRRDVFHAISARWGKVKDYFGEVAFASNYMNLRFNETKSSRYWICPGIKYSYKQFTRDAFWQTLTLPLNMEQQCYNAEAFAKHPGAERPLLTLIWTYRIGQRGGAPDLNAAKACLKYIETHTSGGFYYSNNNPAKKDFQSWYDDCAFDDDDVVCYNQGLLVVALLAAQKLGLTTTIALQSALGNYRKFFNAEKGYYPLSIKKNMFCVDALVGDLLAQVMFDYSLLTTGSVNRHYAALMRIARTKYGFKVTCADTGDYLPPDVYNTQDFQGGMHNYTPGEYQLGGSWYLYDMLCLLDCYLHGIPGVEEQMIWRTKLEFEHDGTYHECINTSTGKMCGDNQGWDGAIHALWRILMEKGRADGRFLREIEPAEKKGLLDETS